MEDKLATESEINAILHDRHLESVIFVGVPPDATNGIELTFSDLHILILGVPVDFKGETAQEAIDQSTRIVFSVLDLRRKES